MSVELAGHDSNSTHKTQKPVTHNIHSAYPQHTLSTSAIATAFTASPRPLDHQHLAISHDVLMVLDTNTDDGAESYLDAVPDKLPYSTQQRVALVATVTGACFINVRFSRTEPSCTIYALANACLPFVKTLSVQAVVIILPSIGRDLAVPDTRLQWIVSAYAITFGCFLLLWGRIADIFGKKAIFVAGSAWFTATTVANPFVRNEIAFNVLRGLQGLGAAANVPTAIGILGTTFASGSRAKNYAFAAYGAGAPLGSVFGNLLAGLIASYASWKWVFGVLAILSGIVTVVGYLIIPAGDHISARPSTQPVSSANAAPDILSTTRPVALPPAFRSIDWFGGILVTLGLLGLLFALTEGNVVGWSTPWVGALIGTSALLIVGFVLWQLVLESAAKKKAAAAAAPSTMTTAWWPPLPLVRMSIFRRSPAGDWHFGTSLVIMALFYSSFHGFLIFATYFYQDYQGLSPLQTTLRFLPTGVVGVVACFCVAPLLSRVPTYLLLLFGTACITLSSLLLAALPLSAHPRTNSYFAYGFEAMTLSVLGVDTAWPSLMLFVSHALPTEDQALGGALVNMAGQVGQTLALAAATVVQTAVMASARSVSVVDVAPMAAGDDGGTLKGLRAGSWVNVGLGAASVVVVVAAFRGSGVVGKAPAQEQPRQEQGPTQEK